MPLTYANKPLGTVGPVELQEVEVIVDSGACETVMPRNLCQLIPIVPSAQSIAKVEYQMASGKDIPNLGERHCEVYAEGSPHPLLMHFQVADVHRPLLSLSKAADMGFRSYLDDNGAWLEDVENCECLPIERKGDSYVMKLWVRGVQAESAAAVEPSTPFVGRG